MTPNVRNQDDKDMKAKANLLGVCVFTAFACFVTAVRADYDFEIVDGGVEITHYNDREFTGVLEIPAELGGHPVVSLGSGSFGYDPFSSMPPSAAAISGVVIPDSVVDIADYAFAYCPNLVEVVMGQNVVSIGMGGQGSTFAQCNNLQTIDLGESLEMIGDWVFWGCEALANITFPNSLTSIGANAFSGCNALTSVAIPEHVEHIGAGAFGFFGIAKLFELPYMLESLTNITVSSGNAWYSDVDGVLFDKDQRELIQYPGGREGPYTIPEGVLEIMPEAFRETTALTALSMPDSLTSIGFSAFSGCTNLASVAMSAGITNIADGAFQDCLALVSIDLPTGLTHLGGSAFRGCQSLLSIHIPGSLTSMEDSVFAGCSSLEEATIAPGLSIIPDGTFRDCEALTSVALPDTVIEIGGSAFSGCSSLTNIILGRGLEIIGAYAFDRATSLTSIVLPESVALIGEGAFYDCESLAAVMFRGHVPDYDVEEYPFGEESQTTVFYRYGAEGWEGTFAGRPTAIWPEMADAAITPGGFGFDIIASEDQEVVVEACSDLMTGAWTPISTNTVPSGELLEFTDPEWDTDPSRFYRIVLP